MKLQNTLVATAAVMAMLALAACSGGGADQARSAQPSSQDKPTFEAGTTMAKLSEAGTMTVGTKFDQPLFGLKELDGVLTGFDVEIAKIVAGQLGIPDDKVEFVETPSAVREEAIISGKADIVVATYFITDERKKRVTFAGPYYIAQTNLMVKSDNDKITNIDSIKDPSIKVCSAAGAGQNPLVSSYMTDPGKQLVLFDVYSKCADALRTGQVDAVVSDSTVLLGLVVKSDGNFKIVGDSYQDQPFGIGVKKDDVAFCEFINDTLTQAYDDGRYQKAWDATVGPYLSEVPPLPDFEGCE